jgi:uncharacterized membrane protein
LSVSNLSWVTSPRNGKRIAKGAHSEYTGNNSGVRIWILLRLRIRHFVFFIAATTLLEYSTGWYFLHQFHLRLWNYCDISFNYNGFVALPFSLAWGVLGLVFKQIIHPFIKAELSSIPLNLRLRLASLFGIYLLGDIFYSLILITRA